jgi:molecular chaperone GrpE
MEKFNYPNNWPKDWPTNKDGHCSLCKEVVPGGMEEHMGQSHPKKLAGFEFLSNDGELFKFSKDGRKILESKLIYGENFVREKRILDFLKKESQKWLDQERFTRSFLIDGIIKGIKNNKHLDIVSSSDQVIVEKENFEDKYLRAIADLENYRKRIQKDKDNWTQQAVRSLSRDLVGVLENLELTLKTTEKKNDDENLYEGHDEDFLKGIKAVNSQLANLLKQRKVEEIKVKVGDKFDPDLHNVLLMQEDPDVEGQVIGMVLRPGYMIKEQVLRPAQVQVLKGISKEEGQDAE